jgi:hypothetical protein
MMTFWPTCGYALLERGADGRLVVTDDYLRSYYLRPELAPVPESCASERALHQALLDAPRRGVAEADIAAIADEDARENYRVMLRFRDQLLSAATLEAFYFDLFRRDVAVPPQFIHHTVQAILRGILDGSEDGLEARAAELFFRAQRVTVKEGAIMLADDETVEMHATGGALGNLGRLLSEARAPLRTVELDVLDEGNGAEYWKRDERHDTVLNLSYARAGSQALCRVLERWIEHFHGVKVTVKPVREIPDEQWLWHVGLDAEATAVLNEIYNGGEIEEVFLGLATTAGGVLRMKPQNLLMNLPLAMRV